MKYINVRCKCLWLRWNRAVIQNREELSRRQRNVILTTIGAHPSVLTKCRKCVTAHPNIFVPMKIMNLIGVHFQRMYSRFTRNNIFHCI